MLGLLKKMFGISAAPVETAPYKVEGVVEVTATPVAQTATQAMVESLVPAPSAAAVTADNKSKAASAVKRVPANKKPAKNNYRKPAAKKSPVK